MNKFFSDLDAAVARGPNHPDIAEEDLIRYELWELVQFSSPSPSP